MDGLQVSVGSGWLGICLCLELHGLCDNGRSDAAIKDRAKVSCNTAYVYGTRRYYFFPALIASNSALISYDISGRTYIHAAATHPERHTNASVESRANTTRIATSRIEA
jgi:hypothetical protein